MMAPEDLAAVEEAFDALLDDTWGDPVGAEHGDLAAVWKAAAAQGWLEIDANDAAEVLTRVAATLGQHACSLPVADVHVTRTLLHEHDGLLDDIAAGTLRPVVVVEGTSGEEAVEGGGAATHVVVLGQDAVSLRPITDAVERPGIAVPAWVQVTCEEPVLSVPVSSQVRTETLLLMRLFLAARSLAAAGRSHHEALEYAKVRRQFGRPIGGFGAVQQRIAAQHIKVVAATHLVEEAARHLGSGDPVAEVSVELAVGYVSDVVARVQLGSQLTFGAIGFFNEHLSPWLFRRAHADLVRVGLFPATPLADLLLEDHRDLPSTDRNESEAAFREELKGFFAEHAVARAVQPFVDDTTTVAAMAERGYYGMTWPREYGGREASPALQSVLMEEIGYGRVGSFVAFNAVMFLSGAIIAHGSAEQRDRFLPLIRSGALKFCLGYSEPDTGSDLASLRTRAVRDGDEWVINGQKTWTTRANESEWIWLAARTDPDPARRHRGLTMFLLPLSTPGISISEHVSLAGEVSCSVFFDAVHVPDSARVGGVNEGWRVITTALAGERVSLGGVTGAVHAQFDELVAILRERREIAGPSGSEARGRLQRLACTLQAARLLVRAAVDATVAGGGSRMEAPMASVLGGELAEQFGEESLALLGVPAALDEGTPGAAAGGAFSHGLLLSIKYVVGGGTNDILRGVIARSLGLPRE